MKKIQIHGKDYIMVKDRVIYFHENYPNGSIRTELIELTDRFIVKSTVIPDVDKPERYFTGHAEEVIGSTQINKTSALENCETSAIGRSLAALNIGVEESFASGDEVANAINQQNANVSKKPSNLGYNGLKCEKCGSGMKNNKDIDGQPKRSLNYDNLIAEGKTRGLYQPVYKCLNDVCKHSIWEEPEDVKTNSALHKKEEKVKSKEEQESEVLFNEL